MHFLCRRVMLEARDGFVHEPALSRLATLWLVLVFGHLQRLSGHVIGQGSPAHVVKHRFSGQVGMG